MNWVKVEIRNTELGNRVINVPSGFLLVSNGKYVEPICEHGWDGEDYYFQNRSGKLLGVTHFIPFPRPPVNNHEESYITDAQKAHQNLSNLLSLKDFSRKHQAFSEASLRWRYDEAKKGKTECIDCFYKIEGRVYIHESKFLKYLGILDSIPQILNDNKP
jgi:hypothetical protein